MFKSNTTALISESSLKPDVGSWVSPVGTAAVGREETWKNPEFRGRAKYSNFHRIHKTSFATLARPPPTMPQRVSANLDFLRAVAVLLVLGQHLTARLSADSLPLRHLGTFGVLLFFVHTCLVLMYSMERSHLWGRELLKDFYIRRIFRIYPLGILAVTGAVVFHLNSNINGIAGLSYGPLPSKKAILAHFLLVQNLALVSSIVNVLWSLPFELQMYLFLPFLFMWVKRKRIRYLLLGLWAVSVGAAALQPHVWFLNRASLLRFRPCFLPGIIAFAPPYTYRIRSVVWPVFVLALIGAYNWRPSLSTGWILCLLLGLAIPHFQEIRNSFLCRCSNGIATYSYGIYIAHPFCIWLAFGVLAGVSLWARLAVLISSLVCFPLLLYHLVEKPMIRVGVRLAHGSRERTEVAVVAAA